MIDEIQQVEEQQYHSSYLQKKIQLGEVVDRSSNVILSKCQEKSDFGDSLDSIVKESLHSNEKPSCCTKFCFQLCNEFLISSQLCHPNIVNPHRSILKYSGGCCIVFPRADCDAFSYLLNRQIDINIVKLYLKSMASALAYLHDNQNIAHNDFKLENVIVFNSNNSSNIFQLTDFGYSYYLGNQSKSLKNCAKYWSTRNTIYLSPTICNNINFNHFNSLREKEGDMFSLGCTIFMILFRKYPFGNNLPTLNEKLKVCEDISSEGVQYFDQFQPSFQISNEDKCILVDLIINLLQINDTYRLTAAQIANCQWLN